MTNLFDSPLGSAGGGGSVGAASTRIFDTEIGGVYGDIIGDIDGINTTFQLVGAGYDADTIRVFYNGTVTALFTKTTPASGIFDVDDAPVPGDILTVIAEPT